MTPTTLDSRVLVVLRADDEETLVEQLLREYVAISGNPTDTAEWLMSVCRDAVPVPRRVPDSRLTEEMYGVDDN